jgi:hypothetical protein
VSTWTEDELTDAVFDILERHLRDDLRNGDYQRIHRDDVPAVAREIAAALGRGSVRHRVLTGRPLPGGEQTP